jgi:hypothetical protein
MKTYLINFAIIFLILTGMGSPHWIKAGQGGLLQYEVISVNPQNWVVTAKELGSGEIVKFRLPPKIFMGRTFDVFRAGVPDAALDRTKIGNRFSINGAKNTRLDNLIMKTPLTKGPLPAASGREALPHGPRLTWEIINVNPNTRVITARKRRTSKIVKLKIHPEAFKGLVFKANLRGIQRGKGFSIVTPNNLPIKDCCTLLEYK